MPKPSRKDDIIKTAYRLFNEYGYHATGIDLIIQETGVSKKTLYNYFRSKEALIVAVLEYHNRSFEEQFIPKVNAIASTPKQRILASFDVIKDWLDSEYFFGCMFISAIGEYAADESIRHVCKRYKSKYRDYFYQLCLAAGYQNSVELANELTLLVEGAIVTAQVNQNNTVSNTAKKMALRLLDATE